MLERVIILPTIDNDRNYQGNEVSKIIDEIIGVTHGASISSVDGYWQDDTGKLYKDAGNVRVSVTIDEATDKRLYALLPGYCARLKQLALYTHKAQVEVEFVECTATLPQAA